MMKELEKIQGKELFRVPDKYFEKVSRKIISATAGETENTKTSVYRRLRPFLLVAASITGFILISYTALRLLSPSRSERMLSEVLAGQSESALLNELDLFDLEESAASITFTSDHSGAQATEIIDYLLFENIEVSEIYEKL